MESTLTRQTYFDITNKDDKHFFAPFFNQARHNAYSILNNISEIMRLTSSNETPIVEGKLWHDSKVILTLLAENQPDQRKQQGIIDLLDRWMPFVIIGCRNNPKQVGNRLKSYLWLLNNYRNYFSHYYHKPTTSLPLSPAQFHNMGKGDAKIFRFNLNLASELTAFWKKSLELLDKHFATVFKHDDKTHLENMKLIEANEFSKNGLLFFVCLFLEIDDMHKLLSRTKYFKGTHTNAMRATREAFSRLASKLPRPKVHSTDEKQALLLDMLNELAKAPKGVYNHLVEEQKAKLFIDIQEEFATTDSGETDFRRIELRRKRDRFPYFALKFLEVSGRLPNVLFHLNLGKRLIKPVYTKQILGKTEERRLTDEILTFGRLADFQWKDQDSVYAEYIEDTEGINRKHEAILHLKYPLEQYRPKYHFSRERIGIRFKTNDDLLVPDLMNYRPLAPELFISLNDLPKLVMMCLTQGDDYVERFLREKITNKKKLYNDIISGELSPDQSDLPIQKGTSYTVSEKEELGKRFDQLSAKLEENYKLTSAEIPEKVRDYLVQQKHRSLKQILRAKMVAAKEEAEGLYNESKADTLRLKKGELATLIARDMVKFFKPVSDVKDGKHRVKKLNSTQYQLLQSKLAYFGASKNELLHLCEEFGIFSRHRFVNKSLFKDVKINGKMVAIGIKKFFRNYYAAKKNWLETEIKHLDESSSSSESLRQKYYMFELYNQELDEQGLYKTDFIRQYVRTLKTMPIYLARNSFDRFLPKGDGHNFVKWMEVKSNGAKQWFYNVEYLMEESNPKARHQRDKLNRHDLTKDRVLWEMAKAIGDVDMKRVMDEIDLSSYAANDTGKGRNILETRVEVQLDLEYQVSHQNTISRTVNANIKLVDYGSLRKFLKDRRLPGLFSYYPDGEDIPLDILKVELKKYENDRHHVLKDAFRIEKKIYEDMEAKYADDYMNFRTQLGLLADSSSSIWNKANRGIIVQYRNMLLHNKIPARIPIDFEKGKVVELLNLEIKRKFAEMLSTFD